MPTSDEFLKELLDLDVPSEVHISKDGKHVVYATGTFFLSVVKNGDHRVSKIWHAESGKANSARQLTLGLRFDRQPKISPDGKTIAFISDRAKQGESSAIYLLSLSGGEPYPITPAENESTIGMIEWSPDGNSIAYTSADEKTEDRKAKDKNKDDAKVYDQDWQFDRLRLVNVDTKDIKTIVSIDKQVGEFDWHPDGKSLAFLAHRNPDFESLLSHNTGIYTVETTDGKITLRADFPTYITSPAYTEHGIYFNGTIDQKYPIGGMVLWKVDLKNNTGCQRVAHGDTDCSLTVKKAGKDVICSVDVGLESELELVDGPTILRLPNKLESWNAAYSKDSDELILALIKSDINNPSEVYSRTASGGALVKLSNHGSSVAKTEIAKANILSCKTLDGKETIQGIFYTPIQQVSESGKPSKPLSTVVTVHGGPYYRNTDEHNPSYFYFANIVLHAGYAVLLVNYRGTNGRGERFAGYARGGYGFHDQPDIIAMTQHSIEQGFANKDELIVSGWSQGGFMSYLSAVRNGMHEFGWKFKGAIPGAGIVDWDTMTFTSDVGFTQAAMAGTGAWAADKSDIGNRNGSAIWEFKKAVEAKAIPPLLMLHGEADTRVPLEQATAFRRALIHHNLPFELVVYPREGHDIEERKHLEDMNGRFLRFVNQHLAKN